MKHIKYPAIIILALVCMAIFLACSKKEVAQKNHSTMNVKEEKKGNLYYCPMHPSYTSDKPGQCLICGMDLV